MDNKCKKCLLLEAGEKKAFETLKDYIDTICDDDKVSESEYNRRLLLCKKCSNLISGMCLKCGCYVELRAVLKEKHCADFDNRIW